MKERLKNIISKALEKQDIKKDIDEIVIEIPKERDNGDYSSNIAMQLTKELHRNPREIAEELKEKINDEQIVKIEVAGPGFLNFFVKKDYLFENIKTILNQKENYGKSNIGNKEKLNIEFVSANPTGILHLGHARGASYGDSLARILEFAGYDVTREYYINDAGNQIHNLELSIIGRYEEVCGRPSTLPEEGYHGKEIIDIAKELKETYGENGIDSSIVKQKGLDYLLGQIKKDLTNFRVSFDIWSSEKSIYEKGLVDNVKEELQKKGYTYEENGALWLKTSMFGDEKDRVIVKADGSNTYLLPDIAYHKDKYSRGYDKLVDVFGADHHGYIARLKGALAMLGENPEKLDIAILQMVRLVRGKEEIKMSKRTGNAVTINELVDEVGLNGVRYFFLARSIDTQMDFDLELATKQSNENPVYYIEYAHARICSILEEYKEKEEIEHFETITSSYAIELLSKMYEFKNIVEIAARKRVPHMITNYVYDLATLFHTFYAHEKVLTEDKKYTNERIHLIEAVGIVIRNALALIGVEARNKM